MYSEQRPLHVAIVGSGPSGIYAAEILLKQKEFPVKISIFERLPTPFGLVRYGVAPDHLSIKSVTKAFEKTLVDERVAFCGGVEIGVDIQRSELLAHFDAVIYAYGASGDRRLGVVGEDAKGSLSATEFVAWYNGHPDAAELNPPLDRVRGVAVVGLGNVALDVSRILAKTADELQSSDIAPHALEALKNSAVEDIYILGRRGPLQAKFTTKELKEFGHLAAAEPVVLAAEGDFSDEDLAQVSDPIIHKNAEVLRQFLGLTPAGKPRRVHLRFLVSPLEILQDEAGDVSGVVLQRNRLTPSGGVQATDKTETIAVQMVLRSVGYRGAALPEVPFDEARGIVPHEGGRMIGGEREYTTGWIKRGPSGVVGTNRKCASETVDSLLADAREGRLLAPRVEEWPSVAAGKRFFGLQDWQRLDAHERQTGEAEGRPRRKVVNTTEMWRLGGEG